MRVMRLCDEAVEWVRELERALARQAQAAGPQAVAAYTHLQPAQPVLLAHWWLAHVAAFERDEERFLAAREAADRMPLGAGAIAGTPLQYDRVALAGRLGFDRVAENSLDAVGDRDFALEYLNAAALLGVHLARLGEDLVLACSPAFGWFAPADGFSTGSSLLPQKRNPDLFELARGKAARLLTNAQRLAIVLKGLPSGYQKDLQEDKEAVFDTADTLEALLAPLPDAIVTLAPRPERMSATLTPDLLAVELADALVDAGVPFRDAHAAVGRLWSAAERGGVPPAGVPLAERLAISPHFTDERLAGLSVESALARRNHTPGAGPSSVATQLRRAEARLGLGPGDPEEEDGGPRSGQGAEGDRVASPDRPDRMRGGARSVHDTQGAAGGRMPEPPSSERGGPGTTEPSGSEDESPVARSGATTSNGGITIRRAKLADVPGIAALMAHHVADGTLLPRPVGELYQCIREFFVAETGGRLVGCAALRLLWDDMGEVRSLVVHEDWAGNGIGQRLVAAVLDAGRAVGVPRVIALTREVKFFEKAGFTVASRERLPRKVWTDCVRCPKRHACDETAVVLDLVPGATEAAERAGRSWVLPIPMAAGPAFQPLPIVS
jgi:argininosuccinate lyase